MRESSPPEATSRSGRSGVPGFALKRNSTSSAPRGPSALHLPARLDRDAEGGVREREAAELLLHAGGHGDGAGAPRLAQELGAAKRRALRVYDPPLERGPVDLEGLEDGQALGRALGVGEHLLGGLAVLTQQRPHLVVAEFDDMRAGGIEREVVEVGAQLGGEVVELRERAVEAPLERS